DFEGFLNGEPFDGGKAEGHSLELGSNSFVPGFEVQLVGMSAGEEKDIDITFPENYAENLAGKAVVFHIVCNEVSAPEYPELDDEFA
ncbi:MAG: FKBP-type peptidyl-prolyl cis-trans isomerase, partial [Lachnospiraceae bacterium]|nr:FKBP-type peptidyl-prolyl cis-trans isomerase [Lachnospiraceae bacterium]